MSLLPSIPSVGDLISGIANPYGAPATGLWNLQNASFTQLEGAGESVIFLVETGPFDPTQKTGVDQISDSGSRRLAVYEYPYVDGQVVADLGRKGEKFTFNIKFYGSNYQVLFKNFLDIVVDYNGSGQLAHPVRGVIAARFQDYEIVHRYDEWNAVTIKATFIEDNTEQIQDENLKGTGNNSALRSALQSLTSLIATISGDISTVSAALLLPSTIKNAFLLRLASIEDQFSGLLSQLSATFGTDQQTQNLFAQASSVGQPVTQVTSGSTAVSTLSPVFQVGFSPSDQTSINSNLSSFIANNQVTPQQAVFVANIIRGLIASEVAICNSIFGNSGFNIALSYRQLAIAGPQVTQSCIAASEEQVTVYTVLNVMSVRMIAYLNGLTPDSQNDIQALNPYLQSLNYVLPDTQVLVPVA